ncbi:hypothetical protein KSD_89390 [Ktedonobacter sp. SOSP1-85]|uniref:hypothetical protein n=1 Tax=Ktedonobacter sp. SOSP1-85 TaxID=2778367 RepID=UPI001914DA78|nr:hypothetical protein [Ktedonobacter sp. SOSP1-85]GHO81168.1 hypothetical protein KSD_89390 [Ktedonobacter sp. SOSP1-85]
MQAEDFVREVRNTQFEFLSPQLLQLVAYKEEIFPNTEERGDQNAEFRLAVLEKLHKTLSPGDWPLVRFLLKQEITFHENAWCIYESIRLCGFLLSLLAQVEDVGLLWEAKTTSFDTMCGFDVQFLVGAGVASTVSYLQSIQEEWAQDALTYIEESQKAGDFHNLEHFREATHKVFREQTI